MRLKELREQKKITQTQLAKEINIHMITYTRYENGLREPNLETLIKLANYYGVTLDYLVDREFANEFGYLNEIEKKMLENFRKLTPEVQIKFADKIEGAVIAQN